MCRPCKISFAADKVLPALPLRTIKRKDNDDITLRSLYSLSSSSNDADAKSDLPVPSTVNSSENGTLPSSGRVYQTMVVEPFQEPSISLIFRSTNYSSAGEKLTLLPLTSEYPSEYPFCGHYTDHLASNKESEEKDELCMTPRCYDKMDITRYVYETPPPSSQTRYRISLLDTPPTPRLKRTIIEFTPNENASNPEDLFLPLILT